MDRSRTEGPDRGWGAELLIVIVCYRVPDLTIDCLRSLESEIPTVPGAHVVVCENGTGGGSLEQIRNAIDEGGWNDWVTLQEISPNRGFAGGNNYVLRQDMEAAKPSKYVLLLNADTVVHPGCLKYCYDEMERSPDIGALSCGFENVDGSMQNVARKFPSPLRAIAGAFGLPWRWPSLFGWADTEDLGWDRETTKRDVEWIGGAFLLVPGELMKRIGVLDEDFVFYGEDIEYSHRVWKSGYRVHFDPAVAITHLGGGSNDATQWSSDVRGQHAWRSRYVVQRKCWGRLAAWSLRAADLLSWSIRWLVLSVTGRWGQDRHRAAGETVRTLAMPLSVPEKAAAK